MNLSHFTRRLCKRLDSTYNVVKATRASGIGDGKCPSLLAALVTQLLVISGIPENSVSTASEGKKRFLFYWKNGIVDVSSFRGMLQNTKSSANLMSRHKLDTLTIKFLFFLLLKYLQ